MEWFNLQMDQQTPLKESSSENKRSTDEQSKSAATPSDDSNSTPGNSPDDVGEKSH